ncbi:MAG TPA: MBL fold metallo-hydrolase [Pseudonocardia sp.]|uniref:MBL fold metallo-hydrolase n=1 Tax=Pseudonocardia sp. TaxID=60912 RepID=UPI002C3D5EC4|nr:MBL fold metallo-hydrolase [Pseudonocardia sp.]HTF55332.1 MBL fold metallo-hydrolase [Pseudonocardia sp.]
MNANNDIEQKLRISSERQRFAVGIVGGPTTVIDVAGRRIVIDPTFDPPGVKGYLKKTEGPAVSAVELGKVDVVLVSHDQHPDNLDERGRTFARSAPLVLTGPSAAERLGLPARALKPWESFELPGTPALRVQAVPAVHGPADGNRDEKGFINTEVTGFVLSGQSLPTIYLSGDNASLDVVSQIAERWTSIDVAVLFAGAARVPTKERARPLTLTSARAAAAAELLDARVVIPSHYRGWAHFTEGEGDLRAAFDDAGFSHVLHIGEMGQWIQGLE